MYQRSDCIVLVQFLRRYILAESYTRLDKHEFSDKELSAFLEGSSNGRQWNKGSEQTGMGTKRSQGKCLVRNTVRTTDATYRGQVIEHCSIPRSHSIRRSTSPLTD